MKGKFIINDGELFQVYRFYKYSNQLTKSIAKMIDRYDEILEVLFSGYTIKCTTVFNQINGSSYGMGCDAFNKTLEYEGQFCYICTGNACFRICLENIYKRVFSNEDKELILSSDRCENIMTLAKIQPFCMQQV